MMRILIYFIFIFTCIAANAQNASTGSNSESDFKTEERTGVSRERSMDTSRSKRSESSSSEEHSLSDESSYETAISNQESRSKGHQFVNEYSIDPVRIVTSLIRELEVGNTFPTNQLVKQIRACRIFTDPCTPSFSPNASMEAYDYKNNRMVYDRHDDGMACNQFNNVANPLGDFHYRIAKRGDLLTRTAACYALSAYTIEAAINAMTYDNAIKLDMGESFIGKAKDALATVIQYQSPKIMAKAMSFGKSVVGVECRIPTSYGFGAKSIHEWYCGGLKVSSYDVSASYQGMSLVGGADILGQNYVVQRRVDSSYQIASEESSSQRKSTSESISSTDSKSAAESSENNVSMRRSSTSENGSTITTGVSTRNDATAASQK